MASSRLRVLVTGAAGFIGRNLSLRLRESGHTVLPALRTTTTDELKAMASEADAVVHLAGVNRPESEDEFDAVNDGFTALLVEVLANRRDPIPVIASSSTQVELNNAYGRRSKQKMMTRISQKTQN